MALMLALALAATAPETQLATLDRNMRAQELRLARMRAPLSALVARIQRIALRPPAAALLDTGSAQDLIRARALLASLPPMIRMQSAPLRRQMAEAARTRAKLEQVVATRADARMRFGSLEQASLNHRLAALPAPTSHGGSNDGGQPVYLLPANGRVVTGTGERDGTGLAARGLTLVTSPRAEVVAPAAGRVVYAGPFRGYGDIALLDHGGGWATLLAGLSLATVARGEQVAQGTTVGRMGSASPRLTIELSHGGRPVDVAGMAAQRH
jgi:murein hydrolase activator